MTASLTQNDAWKALDELKAHEALEIWNELIQNTQDESEKDLLRSNSCNALIDLGRFDEARTIYLELFEKDQSIDSLHSLAMLERETENFKQALEYVKTAFSLIKESDHEAYAKFYYEYSKNYELLGELDQARDYCQKCHESSLLSKNQLMNALSLRLQGDLMLYSDTHRAKGLYFKAQELFHAIGDEFACDELEDIILEIEDQE